MFIRSLFALIVIAVVFFAIRHIRKNSTPKRPRIILKYAIYTAIIVLISLAIVGKIHWITAGIVTLFPIVQKLFPLLLRALPFINSLRQKHHASTRANAGKMTVKVAREIFGVDPIYSKEQVIQRHRELMQKNHPDRGGSDYLAAQINQAKDILIEHLKHTHKS